MSRIIFVLLAVLLTLDSAVAQTCSLSEGNRAADADLVLPPKSGSTPADPRWNQRSIEWVASVETTASDPYVAVTGNFDGNGISVGLLQWNFGRGSLQRLLKDVADHSILDSMPTIGEQFNRARKAKPASAVAIAVKWQDSKAPGKPRVIVRADAKRELQALLGSQEVRAIQEAASALTAEKAYAWAERWAKQRRNVPPSFREHLFFLDTLVFNGDANDIWADRVDQFRGRFESPDDMLQYVYKWTRSCPGEMFNADDAKNNISTWEAIAKSQGLSEEQIDLLAFGYLRAVDSKGDNGRFKSDVWNRRAILAFGKGKVHGLDFDYESIAVD